jgi:hypothetical protein
LSENKTEGTAVSYESKGSGQSSGKNFRRIEIDERPPGSGNCDMDLDLKNTWFSPSQGVFNIRSEPQEYGSGKNRTLGFGYMLSSNNCVFASHQFKGCATVLAPLACPSAGGVFSFSPGQRSVKALGYLSQKFAFQTGISPVHEFDYTLVECTTNSHCKENVGADPSKGKCNLGIPTLPSNTLNTCVDSVAPASVIEPESQFSPVPGLRILDNTRWLKEGTYQIFVGDSDALSGLDTCHMMIQDNGVTTRNEIRSCNSEITLKVKKNDSTADCRGLKEGPDACFIFVRAIDKAGNVPGFLPKPLNIDLTPPTAQ